VAEQFADAAYEKVESLLPTKEERSLCASSLGEAFRKCIDSDSERYRIIDFQIQIFNALKNAVPGSPKFYRLEDELDSVVAEWISVLQRFR